MVAPRRCARSDVSKRSGLRLRVHRRTFRWVFMSRSTICRHGFLRRRSAATTPTRCARRPRFVRPSVQAVDFTMTSSPFRQRSFTGCRLGRRPRHPAFRRRRASRRLPGNRSRTDRHASRPVGDVAPDPSDRPGRRHADAAMNAAARSRRWVWFAARSRMGHPSEWCGCESAFTASSPTRHSVPPRPAPGP